MMVKIIAAVEMQKMEESKKKTNKTQCSKAVCLKGSAPELKDNYFLTLEDDKKNKKALDVLHRTVVHSFF